jgi:hypothetical protein
MALLGSVLLLTLKALFTDISVRQMDSKLVGVTETVHTWFKWYSTKTIHVSYIRTFVLSNILKNFIAGINHTPIDEVIAKIREKISGENFQNVLSK